MSAILTPQKIIVMSGLALMGIFALFLILWNSDKRQKKAVLRMRQPPPPVRNEKSDTPPIRTSDTIKLNKDSEGRRKYAEGLIAQGKIVEGALILESLQLQRFAISALENAGEIDEACAILVRMDRPNRAGVVYGRNGMHEKSAHHYLIAGLFDEAAKAFMEAGKSKPDCYLQAAQIFEKTGQVAQALQAYSSAGKAENVVAMCVRQSNWQALKDFMGDARNAKSAFQYLDTNTVVVFISELEIDTQTTQSLALWSASVRRFEVIECAMRCLQEHRTLASLYWSLLPEDLALQIVRAILQAPQFQGSEGMHFKMRHAHALYDTKRFSLAAQLYDVAGRHNMAAKCWVALGELDRALALLSSEHGDEVLARSLGELLEKEKQKRAKFELQLDTQAWDKAAVSAAIRILENVTPDSDELHESSPFSLNGSDLAS